MIDNGNGIYGNEILYIGLISMKVCKCNFRMDFRNNMEMMRSTDVGAKRVIYHFRIVAQNLCAHIS